MAKKKIDNKISNLELTFFRELWTFYSTHKNAIKSRYYDDLTLEILNYNDPDLPPLPRAIDAQNDMKKPLQRLRRPQFEAFEIYVFLKECLKNAPVHEIFEQWYHRKGVFKNRHNLLGEDERPVLDESLVFNLEAYEKLFQKMKESNASYANYIFALTMGVGKTRLIGLCIFYDFLLGDKHPENKLFCHHALIFAPDKTVLQSLKEIFTFDKNTVLPPHLANWIQTNISSHFLLETGEELPTLVGRKYNIIISNNQKIILKVIKPAQSPLLQLCLGNTQESSNSAYAEVLRKYRHLYDKKMPLNGKKLQPSQRYYALERLDQIGIFVDEAHHAFGNKLKKELLEEKGDNSIRATINVLAFKDKSGHSKVVGCYNFTGTPYVENTLLPDVVYGYGLCEAIRSGYLKKPLLEKIRYREDEDRELIKNVIKHFLEETKGKRVEGMLPKLAIFAAKDDDAGELKPLVEEEIGKYGIPPSSVLVNVSDPKLTTNDDIREFNNLDTPESEKQFIILVGKGKEGWNCRSLFGVALFRKPDKKSKVFVLQATMRCLRSIGDEQETGYIYLSEDNFLMLEQELKQNFRVDIEDFKKSAKPGKPYTVKVWKRKTLPFTYNESIFGLVEKNPVEPIHFEIEKWNKDKRQPTITPYSLEHNKLVQKDEEQVFEDTDKIVWTGYMLVGEVSRYMNISPLKIKNIINESNEGMDAILDLINKKPTLFYDELVPRIFKYLYGVNEYKQEKHRDIDLVTADKSEFTVHGKEDLTDELKTWESQHPSLYDKSFHLDTYCFDSTPEKDFFERVISANEIDEVYFTGMLTAGQSDFFINYIDPDTHGVRSYYPDFLIKTKTGEWLVVEVKAANQIDDPVVQAKKQFAESFLKQSNIKYHIVPHNEVNSINLGNLLA